MPQRIEISYKTIVFTVAFLLGLWMVVQIREILFLLFLSFIAASGFRPVINKLEHLKIPRVMAILIIYFVIFLLLFVMLYFIIPVLIEETIRMIRQLIYVVEPLSPYLNISPEKLTEQLGPLSSNLFRAT